MGIRRARSGHLVHMWFPSRVVVMWLSSVNNRTWLKFILRDKLNIVPD